MNPMLTVRFVQSIAQVPDPTCNQLPISEAYLDSPTSFIFLYFACPRHSFLQTFSILDYILFHISTG